LIVQSLVRGEVAQRRAAFQSYRHHVKAMKRGLSLPSKLVQHSRLVNERSRGMLRERVIEDLTREFGLPTRTTVKVVAFDLTPELSVVVQLDAPKGGEKANVWLPYPRDGEAVPEIALEYAGESGRHSGTYASAGLRRGQPALKLLLQSDEELADLIAYVQAWKRLAPLPQLRSHGLVAASGPVDEATPDLARVDVKAMPVAAEPKPRREAIPRAVQREVWQRDAGRCVECGSKEFLCFDHIVPFSRGGSNSVRNLQLLCERCNLSKGNRI